jgi:LuxR family maltose regulon positive regulatory protein
LTLPLLSTKFNLPPVGAKFVRRQRLSRVLDECLGQKTSLILVCGPAGYGKTTAVSEWLQHSQKLRSDQFVWLTLERADDELARFLNYFIAGVQRIRPGFGAAVLKLLQTHKPSPMPVLATLLVNELSEIPERFFLILDDYHLLTAESVQGFMSFLVDHQPAQMCLVLLTRTDPALPLARLRARGQLFELRQEALCFLPDEVVEFVNDAMNLELSPQQLAFLGKQTEGWISGLQLAAISMRQMQDRSAFFQAFSGEHGFVADYLTEEVLTRLPEATRTFLLRTSILERLSAPLCEAVTGMDGAQATLDQLVESNLFIVPLDTQHAWYRYHVLFADLLRKRLQESAADQVQELHCRASRWFEENGPIDSAIEHAIAGKDGERAAVLIEGIAESLLRNGQTGSLMRWLEALPGEVLMKRPFLGVVKGLTLIMCSRPVSEAILLSQGLEASGCLKDIPGEAATLQALLAVMQGRTADAIRLSEEAVRLLPAGRVFLRSLAADGLGMAYTLAGDMENAKRAFEQVVEISERSDNIMMHLMALTNLAGLCFTRGELQQAIQTCRQVIELANQRIGRQPPMLGKTLLNLGEMLREQGDLESALATLTEAVERMEFFSEFGLPVALLALARVQIAQKDWQSAQAGIDRARQLALASRSTQMDDRIVAVMQVRYWIARGELEPAMQWARGRGFLDRSPAEVFDEAARNAALNELLQGEYLALIRLVMAQGKFDRAVEMLAFLQNLIEKRGYQRRIIEVLALKALALHQKGELDQALPIIAKAFSLAEPEGYQRIFVDEGEPMSRLLYQAVSRGISPEYAGRLLAVLAQEIRNDKPVEKSSKGDLLEPLSERELEVLRLIAEGLSNAEIAGRLYISLSTVKGHTANIFGKFGVSKRTQAVAQARRLGLLKNQ